MSGACFCIAAVLSAPALHVSIPSRVVRHVMLCAAICFSHMDRDYAYPVCCPALLCMLHRTQPPPPNIFNALSTLERSTSPPLPPHSPTRAGSWCQPSHSLACPRSLSCGMCCWIGGPSVLQAALRFPRVTRTLLLSIQIVQLRSNRCIGSCPLCIQGTHLAAHTTSLALTNPTPPSVSCRTLSSKTCAASCCKNARPIFAKLPSHPPKKRPFFVQVIICVAG
jgi:hypothetical protein